MVANLKIFRALLTDFVLGNQLLLVDKKGTCGYGETLVLLAKGSPAN